MTATSQQPMNTSEYNYLLNSITDADTKRPSPARITLLSDQQKDNIVHYLMGMKRPIIAGFVTSNGAPALRAAGYTDGYHNQHFAFWILPEHASFFTKSEPATATPPPAPVASQPPVLDRRRKRPEGEEKAEIKQTPDNPALQRIGAALKAARLEKGLTMEQMANHCEISQGRISQIESGRYNVSLVTLDQITQVLGKQITLS